MQITITSNGKVFLRENIDAVVFAGGGMYIKTVSEDVARKYAMAYEKLLHKTPTITLQNNLDHCVDVLPLSTEYAVEIEETIY